MRCRALKLIMLSIVGWQNVLYIYVAHSEFREGGSGTRSRTRSKDRHLRSQDERFAGGVKKGSMLSRRVLPMVKSGPR